MKSIGDSCNELKRAYDTCFNEWFTEQFLKGKSNDIMCKNLFDRYRQCIQKAIKEEKIDVEEIERIHIQVDNDRTADG